MLGMMVIESLVRLIRRRRMSTLQRFGDGLPPDALRVSLGDLNAEVADRLAYYFYGVAAVEVVHGNLLDLDCQAIVSPTNSFGDMGGGIDKAIDDFHCAQAPRRLIAAIAQHCPREPPLRMARA